MTFQKSRRFSCDTFPHYVCLQQENSVTGTTSGFSCRSLIGHGIVELSSEHWCSNTSSGSVTRYFQHDFMILSWHFLASWYSWYFSHLLWRHQSKKITITFLHFSSWENKVSVTKKIVELYHMLGRSRAHRSMSCHFLKCRPRFLSHPFPNCVGGKQQLHLAITLTFLVFLPSQHASKRAQGLIDQKFMWLF